ncbi:MULTISPECIES: TetR/AcrR family transcriptional regulator [Pseudonocardia]|uniref:HTH-type transcriptional repressor KstR2 n=2 Tax=Pseudonocardia TaxID=1847 RepID=A0A1Y2MQA0_PSEAH|nr:MULTISPECIES: TetR/AcrR family transcriptional regulator [Pseudonocardia]OSY37400.1 HTH-type transcriptional repressor KstR2 [Pseudonocardia autotrophica]TDN77275.1 TetR family transcriptional regulator [Pseudonocardia autotrophica]BBG01294.1 TetR family transcriptional regulator [Pseudonocardia autotrophica]GEC26021.1 TetR family transcriptional regulator [Pseudonocardia saturnea]
MTRNVVDPVTELWGDDLVPVARALLTSAVHCFARRGFTGTTTRDISTGAGLSPAALYVHFRSKEDVLFEIARRGHLRALEAVSVPEVLAGADDPPSRLRAVMSRFVTWHALHHVAARVCQYELAALNPEHLEEIAGIRREFPELFRAVIVEGVDRGDFAPVDAGRVVRALLSLGVDLVRWYRSDGPDSPEQLGRFYADLAVSMVSAVPGPPAG